MTKTNQKIDPSGLNIAKNSDGSYKFEWDPKDSRWNWMNGLTDDQVRSIIQESIKDKLHQNDT